MKEIYLTHFFTKILRQEKKMKKNNHFYSFFDKQLSFNYVEGFSAFLKCKKSNKKLSTSIFNFWIPFNLFS